MQTQEEGRREDSTPFPSQVMITASFALFTREPLPVCPKTKMETVFGGRRWHQVAEGRRLYSSETPPLSPPPPRGALSLFFPSQLHGSFGEPVVDGG